MYILHVCDHRDHKLNSQLDKQAKDAGWQQAHLLLQISNENLTKNSSTFYESKGFNLDHAEMTNERESSEIAPNL